MPKILLTEEARAEAAERRQNEAFCWALKTVRARLGKTYTATADAVGVSARQLHNLTQPEAVSNAKFCNIRAVAHAIGMTKAEWLKLGGFDSGGESK